MTHDMAIERLSREQGDQWVGYTEDLVLRFDETMFPEKRHLIFSTSDIGGDITYQAEHDAYFFNQASYLSAVKIHLERDKVPPEMFFYEVQCIGVRLSACAVRLRAQEMYAVPHRTLASVANDARIPWAVRKMLNADDRVKVAARRSKGALRSLVNGRYESQNLDLIIIAALANHVYREGHSVEWLRPFILT